MKYMLLFYLVLDFFSTSAQSVDSIVIKQVDSLLNASFDLTRQKKFDQAFEIINTAETMTIEKLGQESAAYGKCWFYRGATFESKRDLPGAEQCFIKAKTVQEKVLGKEHPDYGASVGRLGTLYSMLGKFDKAEPLHIESMNINKKVYGIESPEYAGNLCNLGTLYDAMANYEMSEQYLLEAKDIFEIKLNNLEHPFYLNCLGNLGALYRKLGYYEKSEPIVLKVLALREKITGKKERGYAGSLMTLASLYIEQGNFAKVEPLQLEAKAILEEVSGKDHPDYTIVLNNMAYYYIKIGNNGKAESLYLEAKTIAEKAFGKEHRKYVVPLMNLAAVNKDMGNYEKSEILNLEAKNLREKISGKENVDYGRVLMAFADLYNAMHQFEKAVSYYLEAMPLLENALGRNHREFAVSLINLANLYKEMGNYEKAEQLALEAKEIWGKELGIEQKEYAFNLRILAAINEIQDRYAESDPLLKDYFDITESQITGSVAFLSGQELATYTASFQSDADKLLSNLFNRLATRKPLGILPQLCADQALFQKGFLLNAANRLNSISVANPKTKVKSDELKGYRRRLSAEYSKPLRERKAIEDLEEKISSAEKELTRSVAGYGDAIRKLKWRDVKARLKQSEAAIEFVHFNINYPQVTDSTMYAALLILPESEQPKFISVFEEKSLDSLLNSKSERKADYVNTLYTLADRGAIAVETPQKSLYEILWKPLEKELTNVNTIYFSPSGLLHRINLDAIPINETETLADRYKLIELNSTRQLVIPTQIKNGNNDAVLYGGIQYEQDSMLQNNEPLMASRSRGELSFSNVDTTLRGGSWTYLAGTEREVNAIEKIMQTSGVQTNLKKGNAATEESFKNIGANNSPSPRILHIATHGYFFPDPKEQSKSNGLTGQNDPVFKISDHPMLRSGLIMAGGNATWQGKQTLEGREDGILTAYEISQMNLSNTELVVLSACETGLGDIQGNEGVYGLQRAFKIAGAKYLIMSLWQVPDKQTSLLMTTFYKKWLEEKMSIPDAFHAAQKELRDLGLDPYQWAGFVLVE